MYVIAFKSKKLKAIAPLGISVFINNVFPLNITLKVATA